MEHESRIQESNASKDVLVINRRSFFGVLHGIGKAGVGALRVIPGTLALLFFPIPFLDRKLERRSRRKPIALLAVATVFVGISFLGFSSHLDDLRDHTVEAQAADASAPTSDGRAVFVSNGCAACHGQNAQGTQFAPTLIGITKKYPPAQLTDLLHHPKKEMRDGGMPPVTVNDAQMQQLVAYLSGLGNAPANESAAAGQGTQPAAAQSARPAAGNAAGAPNEVKAVPLSAEAVRGQAIFQHYSCETCHGIGGLHGTIAAPGLAGLASILPASVLENLLRHHSIRMQEGGMPLTNMKARDMEALVAYIRSMPTPVDGK